MRYWCKFAACKCVRVYAMMMPLPGKYREFWRGIRHGISLCCIIWFIDAHCTKKYNERREYQDRMNVMTGNAGIVLCPECVARTLRSRILRRHLLCSCRPA